MATKTAVIELQVEGLGKVQSAFRTIGNDLARFGLIADGARSALGLIQGAASTLVGVLQTAGEDQRVAAAFESLAGRAGNAAAALDGLREATRGTVSDSDLQVQANRLLIGELDLTNEQMERLFELSGRLGNAMGQTTKQGIDQVSQALLSMQGRGLKTLGVIVDAAKANQAYAASLGTTADALTDQQKRQAFLEATMKALEVRARGLTGAQAPLADEAERLTAFLANLKDEVAAIVAGTPGFTEGIRQGATALASLAVNGARALSVLGPLLNILARNPTLSFALLGAVTGARFGGPTGALIGAGIGTGVGIASQLGGSSASRNAYGGSGRTAAGDVDQLAIRRADERASRWEREYSSELRRRTRLSSATERRPGE